MKFKFRGIARRNKVVFALFTLVVIGSGFLYLIDALHPNRTEAAWFNTNWQYRKAINITAHTSAESSVYLDLSSGNAIDSSDTSRFQGDCGDLRFTDQNGNALPYYIVSGCTSSSTVVHVFMKTFPAGAQTIYYYYGNPTSPNGFSTSDFSPAASGVTIGTLGSEENGPAPTAYWKFDEGTGTTANDSSSNGNTGTLQSSPTWQTDNQCITGKCLLFSGSNYVSVPNNPTMNPTTAYTIESWIKLTSIASSTNYNILAKQIWGSKLGYRLFIAGFGCSNCIGTSAGDGTNQTEATSTEQLTDIGKWHHVVGVFSSGTLYIYLDGKLIKTSATAVTTISNTSAAAAIGRHSSSGENFPGVIDDLKFYKYARSASQIQADYNSRGSRVGGANVLSANSQNSQALSNGLVGHWKMDESSWTNDCSTSTVLDASGNGNSAKSCSNTTGPTGGAVGKFGNGGTFDGTNDYLTIPTSTTLNTTSSSVSASIWINPTTLDSTYRRFIARDQGSNAWFIENNGGSPGKVLFGSLLNGYTTSATTLATGTWYHLVMTIDGTTARLYINGVLDASIASPGAIDTTGPVTIGSDNAGTSRYTGTLDEARVYNRTLTPSDVMTLYNFAPGPVAYYNFEQGQGSSLADVSGSGNNGTWGGTTSHWTQGKVGKGGNFGASDYASVTAGDNSALDGQNGFTYSLWLKRTQNSTYQWPTILGPADTHVNYGIRSESFGDYISFEYGTSPYDGVSGHYTNLNCGATNLPVREWHHFAVTYENSIIRMYRDGVLCTSATGVVLNPTFQSTFYVNRTSSGFEGQMDEIKVYNYARSPKQIISDMNSAAPGVSNKAAVEYYKFDEGNGTIANNSGTGGSSLNGVLTNMDSPATAMSGWQLSGKYGKAVGADGNNDYVTAPSSSTLSSDSLSVSMWFNLTANPDCDGNNNWRSLIKHGSNSSSTTGWDVVLEEGKQVQFDIGINGATSRTGAINVDMALNTPIYLTFTYDASSGAQLIYANGILKSTKTNSPTPITSNANTLDIGRGSNTGCPNGSGYAPGRYDEVKIYNYALTADEIKLDMNHGASQVLGALSDSSGLTGGSVASNSASAAYCVPGDTASCVTPISKWDFEEGQGLTANDSSGNGYSGTITSSVRYAPGQYGKGLYIPSNGQGVTVTGMTGLLGSTVTAEAWVNYSPISSAGFDRVIARGWVGNGWLMGVWETSGSQHIMFGIAQGGTQYNADVALSSLGLSPGRLHLVGIYDGTTTYLYINGRLAASNASAPDGASLDTSSNVVMGGTLTNPITLDSIKLFDYARSSAQVAWDYNNGKPVGYWKMDDCKGTLIGDSSGNGNHGTLSIGASGTQTAVGSCTTPTDGTGAWYNGRSGKYNASMSFDGTDDKITTSLAGTPITTKWTIGYWANITTIGTQQNNIFLGTAAGARAVPYVTAAGLFRCFTSASDMSSTVTLSAGTWYHLACSYDGTTLKAYVNGKLTASGAQSLTLSANNMTIGADNSSFWTGGKLDDVRVYNYALTASQMKLVYNQGAAVRFGPLTGSP